MQGAHFHGRTLGPLAWVSCVAAKARWVAFGARVSVCEWSRQKARDKEEAEQSRDRENGDKFDPTSET